MNKHSRSVSKKTTHFTRRNFLKATSLAITCASFSGHLLYSGIASSSAITAQLPKQIKHINYFEYQVLNHLMTIALPVRGTPLPSPKQVDAMVTLDQALLGGMEAHVLAELKQGIKFFEEGPRSNFQNKAFTQLSASQAIKFCDNWANSDFPQQRGIVMGLKKLVSLAYWSNPATWPTLNYIGPISKRKGIPALGNAPLPL